MRYASPFVLVLVALLLGALLSRTNIRQLIRPDMPATTKQSAKEHARRCHAYPHKPAPSEVKP